MISAISSCPCFVYSKRVEKYLPELFYTDAIYEAIRNEESENKAAKGHTRTEDDKKDARDRRVYWAVLLSAFVIFVNNSRGIQFFLRTFLLIVSFGIIFGSPHDWTLAAVAVLFPFLLVESLQIVVFLGRMFKVSDDDLNLRYYEKVLENLVHRFRSFVFVDSIKRCFKVCIGSTGRLGAKFMSGTKRFCTNCFTYITSSKNSMGRTITAETPTSN